MTSIVTRIRREPALIVGLVQATLVLAASFGLDLTEEQRAALLTLTAVVLSIVTRQMVSPKAAPKAKP